MTLDDIRIRIHSWFDNLAAGRSRSRRLGRSQIEPAPPAILRARTRSNA